MNTDKIGKAIKEACKDDKILENFLLELLNYSLKGRSWYMDEYKSILKSSCGEEKDEI